SWRARSAAQSIQLPRCAQPAPRARRSGAVPGHSASMTPLHRSPHPRPALIHAAQADSADLRRAYRDGQIERVRVGTYARALGETHGVDARVTRALRQTYAASAALTTQHWVSHESAA